MDRSAFKNRVKLAWYHWLVLAASIALTLSAWHISKSNHEEIVKGRFIRESRQLADLIRDRMENYAESLWAGVALYDTKQQISGTGFSFPEWKAFAAGLGLEKRYPGINGIGVIYLVQKDELDSFLSEEKKTRPDFRVHHTGDFPHWPITYIIPVKGNEEAIGLDISYEQNRLEAAQKARDSGQAQITGPITLVQDDKKSPGFLFYAPFYKKNGNRTLEERRKNFEGLVYAPFVVSKLIYGTLDRSQRRIDVRILDQGEILYDEHQLGDEEPQEPIHRQNLKLNFYGRTWTFDLRTTPKFEKAFHTDQPLIILLGGFVIDGLLFALFLNLAWSNQRAVKLAKKMSEEAEFQRKSAAHASKMAALGEMAGGIAHEINNPLSVITSGASLLKDKGLNREEMEMAAQKIEKSVKRITSIVTGLRTFSRDGSKDAFKIEDINSIVHETLDFAQEGFRKEGIKLKFVPSKKLLVECQRVQISQIIINLLNNAKHAAKSSREKFVEVRVSVDPSYKMARIEVVNTGEPIEEEVAEKIFQPFFTTKELGEGTGLGLSISKSIIEGHDGKLFLDRSRPLTTFVIELPLSKKR